MKQAEYERLKQMIAFDQQYGPLVCGMDEVGRGPLAGPVVAACVLMPQDEVSWIEGVKDSKKIAEKKREQLALRIQEKALAYGVGLADEAEIETHNILGATKIAMRRAYQAMNRPEAFVLIDALDPIFLPARGKGIIKGDGQSYAIAAASILAKVTRDAMMRALDVQYPVYGFARNKGYGTKEHREAILQHGVCPSHRMSFLQGILHGK